ncbi:hypothetical protein IP86_17275 [Rhodopseudomonas sp. AAP120]|uniref:hypothetical protein n=1 Tax=Rhodopseudomonas TaxID=1073 RepID=UPI0001779626|nr:MULTISPECIES: hypothetical protein [Rhodopseudomonas]ACE99620.1 hypothetical protein Rpal_1070 [Rhodopseudomonas palustris TIE-1]KPF96177.1 hypothetical protein IP86_17275 [Rhodopseudomonas sp. AAP120]
MSALTKISLAIALMATASAPAFAGMNGTDWLNRERPAAAAQSGLDARAELANRNPSARAEQRPTSHAYFGGPRSFH